METADQRDGQREVWARAAQAWERWQEELREATAPVSEWLVRAIAPTPGQRLLELAAGPGETGFIAAAGIAPGGVLISSDQAIEMVEVARRRAASLELTGVEFAVIDAQRMDLESASVDAVLCRFGYMLMDDRPAALRETRRVLRPGGRVALAVWDTPDRNLWMAAPVIQLVSRGAMSPPPPDAPTPFSLANRDALRALLEGAGFAEITIDGIDFQQTYASFDRYWEITLDLAAPITAAVAGLDSATLAAVRDGTQEVLAQFSSADGSLSVPASAVVACARAA
jgi:SAM-dependent methyltransferase